MYINLLFVKLNIKYFRVDMEVAKIGVQTLEW